MRKLNSLLVLFSMFFSLAAHARINRLYRHRQSQQQSPPIASTPAPTTTPATSPTTRTYSQIELDTLANVNNYRVSLGLSTLTLNPYISQKALEHDDRMIAANLPSHDGFLERANDIMKTLKARTVGENVAYGFTSADSVFAGWFNSQGHRETMEGNYNLAGIAIKAHPVTKKLYYTLILAKI